MVSNRGWLNILLYTSITLCVIGVSLVWLSFSIILLKRNNLNFANNKNTRRKRETIELNIYRSNPQYIKSIRDTVIDVRKDLRTFTDIENIEIPKNIYNRENIPLNSKYSIENTIREVNDAIKEFNKSPPTLYANKDLDLIEYDPTKFNDAKYVDRIMYNAITKSKHMQVAVKNSIIINNHKEQSRQNVKTLIGKDGKEDIYSTVDRKRVPKKVEKATKAPIKEYDPKLDPNSPEYVIPDY